MSTNKNKEYIKNTFILFIGKFATQFSSFLLIPLFTNHFLTEDYGWADLLQSYILLLIPILTLRLDSAVFRFLIDKRNDEDGKEKVITNVLYMLFILTILTVIIGIVLVMFVKITYFKLCVLNVIIMMISNVLIQVLRGLGNNKSYSISSVITGIVGILVNSILILVFDFNASSIFISSIISNLLVIFYVVFVTKIYKYFKKDKISKKQIKSILAYSLPMIPNSLSWWIVNVSDRTLITLFLGKAFNGIYTVSCKFSNVLNSIFSIFSMSWQESASMHIDEDDRDEFFSDMISRLFMLFSCASLLIMAFLPIFYNLLIGKDYLSSYNYIPILLYANSWNVMINLLGGIYIALKKTKEIANTTILSAVINLIIDLLLIKSIGIYAACISTLVACFSMSIYRYIDCKKYLNIKVDFMKIIIFTLIFVISMVMYLINNIYLNIINVVLALIYSFFINKDIILKVFNNIKIKFLNK